MFSIEKSPEFADGKSAQYSILVVDDNELNAEMLSRRLQREGYHVQLANTARNALSMLPTMSVDLILMDIMMPDMDGYELLEHVKKDVRFMHIPVIMITAIDATESVVHCLELGADDYLPKPFNHTLLRARVRACLARKQMHDQQVAYQHQIEEWNAKLESRVKEQVDALFTAQLGAIFAMSKLAESKDPETGTHLERMREYARVIAKQLSGTKKYAGEIDDEFIRNIYIASPLHDIGKVGVPDQILLKPGKLSDEEWVQMKKHTTIGADILREVDRQHPGNSFIHMGIEIAEGHHERWDGTGYPFAKTGAEIPLSARILALGDVYDALTSTRCYKEAFSHEKSRGIILEGRGNHFDPDVVDAFLELEDEIQRIRNELQDPE